MNNNKANTQWPTHHILLVTMLVATFTASFGMVVGLVAAAALHAEPISAIAVGAFAALSLVYSACSLAREFVRGKRRLVPQPIPIQVAVQTCVNRDQ